MSETDGAMRERVAKLIYEFDPLEDEGWGKSGNVPWENVAEGWPELAEKALMQAGKIIEVIAEHPAKPFVQVLADIREYLDSRADAEYHPGIAAPSGNDEMRLLVDLDEAIAIAALAKAEAKE